MSTPVTVIGTGPRRAGSCSPSRLSCSEGAGSRRRSVIRRSLAGRLRWTPHMGVSMRIAQLAPTFERVPPRTYGGTELIVGLVTDELVRRGHDVTLFASGDSRTAARLVSPWPRALRLDPAQPDSFALHTLE